MPIEKSESISILGKDTDLQQLQKPDVVRSSMGCVSGKILGFCGGMTENPIAYVLHESYRIPPIPDQLQDNLKFKIMSEIPRVNNHRQFLLS